MNYTAFLREKIKLANFSGFDVKPEACHPALFDHQRDIVRWAVLGGNRLRASSHHNEGAM